MDEMLPHDDQMGLYEGRQVLNDHEAVAVSRLTEGKLRSSMTRRDPGETGPLLVEAEGVTYEVSPDGEVVKLDG